MIDCKPTERINYSYFVAISVNFMAILAGVGFSWSSPCVPKLSGQTHPAHNPLDHPATIQQIAWITSLHNLGCIVAPLLCGPLTARLGKKRTLLVFAAPQLISNLILMVAKEVPHFYIARFLMGVGTGGATTLIQVYVVEVVPSSHRGRACSFTNWMVTLAQDFVFVLGPYVTIKTLAMVSLVPSITFFVVFGLFVPESPYYFASRRELKEAEAILVKTRRTDNVNEELEKIVRYLNEEKSVKFSLGAMVGSKGVRKSFALAVALIMFQQFAGVNCVFAYQQSILAESESSLPADKSVMVVALMQIIPMILITKLVDTWGRRKLMMLSYAGELVALVMFGGYFFLKSQGVDVSSVFWLPVVVFDRVHCTGWPNKDGSRPYLAN
ncbi:unnamed protein product [Phyllotreta striolata]|uniref:Major facilitator superfamily (MFS) profile domain-containing protein n=1 Tax=Phyllotreta striolata TaxID=444603 RepID=A0A9N9XLA7_PHYSR|nr:unnamed protein product [Phyllotreta striolata]